MSSPFCQWGHWGGEHSDNLQAPGSLAQGAVLWATSVLLCCKIRGFLMSSHLWHSEPVSLGYSWAKHGSAVWPLVEHTWPGFLVMVTGWREASSALPTCGWKVQGLMSSLCPTQIGLLVPTSWSCHRGLGWPMELTYPGPCPLEWVSSDLCERERVARAVDSCLFHI